MTDGGREKRFSELFRNISKKTVVFTRYWSIFHPQDAAGEALQKWEKTKKTFKQKWIENQESFGVRLDHGILSEEECYLHAELLSNINYLKLYNFRTGENE